MSLFVRLKPTFLHIYYTTFKSLICQICDYFSHEYIYYIALTGSFFAPQNPPNIVWRLGSDQTRWGSLHYSAPPDPLAGFRGPTSITERKSAKREKGGANRGGLREGGVEGTGRGGE